MPTNVSTLNDTTRNLPNASTFTHHAVHSLNNTNTTFSKVAQMTMATKKSAPTDDELLAQLDSLSKPKSGKASSSRVNKTASSQSEQDLLAELGNLAQRPTSRPATPSLRPNPATRVERSPKRSTATPPPGRNSEEKSSNGPRKSADSQRSLHQAFTPTTTATEDSPEPEPVPVPAKSGGGWWGGLLSTATAAVTQAQNAVKEIQNNEEAQKWTEQLRGNVGALRGFGGDLRSMALPTFQNLLQTLAPPISAHERLAIHITHDLTNYPTLDPTIYQVFSRVMSQVEGGDLIVVQRGAESGPKRDSKDGDRPVGSWHDGPWWRSGEKRDINAVYGLAEGSKLVRASAEGYASEYFAAKGGVEQAAKKATETLSETNPTRDSEIFLAIQAISQEADTSLFQQGTSTEKEGQVKEKDQANEEVMFAIYLHDPIHGIAFHAVSQAIPKQWIDWLDAGAVGEEGTLPESIQEIIENGGVDPREWVSEWVEESLTLATGVVAQRYVARRMGVGEAGVGRGKARLKVDRSTESTIEGGGGEAARAMGGM